MPRADLQGLRAVAVLAVILDHLFQWPGGGFVGVDIFFVLSGFLITGLLLREYERTNKISWTGFYRRRIKRILPAAVVVLAATLIAAHLAFNASRYHRTVFDALGALFFVANVRFQHLSTDYFHASTPVSPLQHYWSLSIEEQFYFVWPALMLLLFALLLRNGRSRVTARTLAGIGVGVISVGSFVWAVYETNLSVTNAYFSSPSRVWELGAGATLAAFSPLCYRIPDAARPILAWVGLVSMCVSVFVIRDGHGFPAPAAAWPVISTMAVVAAGTFSEKGRQQRAIWPVTSRPVNYLGDISYSLYLWHFPIIIIGAVVWGDGGWTKTWLLVAIFAVSHLSFQLVENPIRRSTKFTLWQKPSLSAKLNILGLAVVVNVLLWAVALTSNTPAGPALADSTIASPVAGSSAVVSAGPTDPPQLARLQAHIKKALEDSKWPDDLHPTMDQAINESVQPRDIEDCHSRHVVPVSAAECAWGNGEHTALLVGDSIGMSYAGPLRAAVGSRGWRFIDRSASACPFVELVVNAGLPTFNSKCDAIRQAALRDIRSVKPDVLFVVNLSWSTVKYPPAEFRAAAEKMLSRVKGDVGKIVFVAPPPTAPEPGECYTPSSSPADCTGKMPNSEWTAMADTQKALAAEYAGVWIDSERWFCYQNLCPPYVGTVPVRPDSMHTISQFGEKLAPVMIEAFDQAGVFNDGR